MTRALCEQGEKTIGNEIRDNKSTGGSSLSKYFNGFLNFYKPYKTLCARPHLPLITEISAPAQYFI